MFNDVAADDGVFGPVLAFDEHIRLQRGDEIVRGVRIEDDDTVDTLERLEHFRALGLRRDWPRRPLVRADRSVGVEADDQRVAQRAGVLQVSEVADVQEIEDAVGEHDLLAGGAQPCDKREGLVNCHGYSPLCCISVRI